MIHPFFGVGASERFVVLKPTYNKGKTGKTIE